MYIILIGAMRTYFKTLKAKSKRVSGGKQDTTNRKQRRRQRMINVSHYTIALSFIALASDGRGDSTHLIIIWLLL